MDERLRNYVNAVCEVKTMDNELLLHGRIRAVIDPGDSDEGEPELEITRRLTSGSAMPRRVITPMTSLPVCGMAVTFCCTWKMESMQAQLTAYLRPARESVSHRSSSRPYSFFLRVTLSHNHLKPSFACLTQTGVYSCMPCRFSYAMICEKGKRAV